MADVTIIYWRDIPAQVMVGKGRKAAKVQLSERFEQAIDRAAMKVGASDSDAYLADWRRETAPGGDGAPDELARRMAERLEADYDSDRLRALIDNNGRA